MTDGLGFEPHGSRCIVSFSKTLLPSLSTGSYYLLLVGVSQILIHYNTWLNVFVGAVNAW